MFESRYFYFRLYTYNLYTNLHCISRQLPFNVMVYPLYGIKQMKNGKKKKEGKELVAVEKTTGKKSGFYLFEIVLI